MKAIKNAFLAGLAFALLFAIFLVLKYGIKFALIAGGVSGLLFAILIYFFLRSKTINKQTEVKTASGETVLHSGLANHFKGFEGVGGKLYLLNSKLQFQSHNFNVQNHSLDIDLRSIKEVGFYNVTGFVPRGLLITTTDGKTEKFVVGGRKEWKEKIEQAKQKLIV